MKSFLTRFIALCGLFSIFKFLNAEYIRKESIVFRAGDSVFEPMIKLNIQNFYGRNLTLLNDKNEADQSIIPAKFTFDGSAMYTFGQATHDYEVIKVKSGIRTKGSFGIPEATGFTDSTSLQAFNVLFGSHSHSQNRLYLYMRELWFFGAFNKNTNFTIGLFPFELGRGIALGSAYAVDPDGLGYNAPNVVDQFAPGARLSGAILDNKRLTYDLYAEVSNNKSDSFGNTNAKIRGQEYGHRFCQARGFGVVNFIVAARLQAYALKNNGTRLVLEPYVLFDDEKEQKVDVLGDASSKLGTLGFAFEGTVGNFEFGGEFAQNVGHQKVKGIDRNVAQFDVREGVHYTVNSNVIAINTIAPDIAGKNAVFTKTNQEIINSSIQAESQNGKQIGTSNLKNNATRFRDPYCVNFHGNMFVFDMLYNLQAWSASIAAGMGYASGDENPHKLLGDHFDTETNFNYGGFISLQEVYSGKRLKSALLLGGPARIPRLLSFPTDQVNEQFASSVQRFTNITFLGGAFSIKLPMWSYIWNVNSNMIAFWQPHASRLFARGVDRSVPQFASTFLGTEINLFLDVKLAEDLKFFATTAIFLAGSHYDDVQGLPINREQVNFLNSFNATGFVGDKVPLLGSDPAFFINTGIEYKF